LIGEINEKRSNMIRIENNADNEPIDIELSTLENAKLDNLNLHRALLSGVNLKGASLTG